MYLIIYVFNKVNLNFDPNASHLYTHNAPSLHSDADISLFFYKNSIVLAYPRGI